MPRILADDLLIHATGPGHEHATADAVKATLNLLSAMGAKPSPSKSNIFSEDPMTRKRLKRRIWGANREAIPVATNARDLGSHLSVGKRRHTTTMAKRLASIAHPIARLSSMPLDKDLRVKLVKGKILPASLYGVEATPISMKALSRLRSRIAEALMPGASHMRAPELVCASVAASP